MLIESENTSQNILGHNAEPNTNEQETLFKITISESEIDQDVLGAINIFDVQESNSLIETSPLQTLEIYLPVEVCSENIAFSVSEADLDNVLQQSLAAVLRIDLPSEVSKVPEVNCAVCHEVIKPGEQAVVCRNRGHLHHRDCWEYNNGHCGVLGCGSRQYKAFDVTQLASESPFLLY